MKRKIILVSQWYPPEQAPIGHMIRELANGLATLGWDVTVITAFPNHPCGEVFGGFKKRWRLEERIDNVRVIRVWLATSKNRSKLNRILSFATFTLTSAWALLREPNTSVIFAVMQPLSVGSVMPILARLKRSRLVFNLQDLHPDVPIELGLLKNPLLIRILRAVEKFGYTNADRLTVIADSFRDHCVANGALASNVAVIPNWIDLDEVRPLPRETDFRREHGISPNDHVILYAGTLGWVSGAEVVLNAACQLKRRTDIKFLFVGGGPLAPILAEKAKASASTNTIFLPFQDRHRLPEVQASSDISIVTLAPGKGRTSVPSKVLGYMAAARPVIASVDVDCETARSIRASDCGIVVPSGDALQLADAILRLCEDPESRRRLGLNGRRFAEGNLAQDTIIARYQDVISQSLETRS